MVEHQRPDGEPARPRNPKAEAKADRAYAKASRPWYKKKRWILPLGLVLLVAVASAGSGGGGGMGAGDGGSASRSSNPNAGGGSGDGGGKAAHVGQAVTNAGTTYEVTGVSTARTIGDPQLVGARADGRFVIVSLKLTNNKDETKTFTESSARLRTRDGNEYETSDKTVLAFGDQSLLLKDIQPDLTARGKLAFDVPPNKVKGSTLVVEDLFGDGEITVDLGL